jgi:hypothetical protein
MIYLDNAANDDGLLYHLALKSRNEKTGPIPVSTSSAATCPDCCPFKKIVTVDGAETHGCYADGGPLAMHWAKVTAGTRGVSFDTFCESVSRLPFDILWRHDQAGDLPGRGDLIDSDKLAKLVDANRGKRGFTYTHKPLNVPGNAEAIAHANRNGFCINLSGNNFAHADELAAADIGPVVVVLPTEYQRREAGSGKKHVWLETLPEYRARLADLPTTTAAGNSVVVCPATYLDDKNCANCGLCAVINRKPFVGFPAHGQSKAKASAVALGPIGADELELRAA